MTPHPFFKCNEMKCDANTNAKVENVPIITYLRIQENELEYGTIFVSLTSI